MQQPLRLLDFPHSNLVAGITAVVGFIGGIYILTTQSQNIVSKIVDRKNKKQQQQKQDEVFCNVCCAEIDPENIKCFVQCSVCQKIICRGTKCADWIPSTALWECQLCHASKESLAQTSSWVAEQASFNQHKFVYPMRARSEIYIPISSDHNEGSLLFESVSQVGGAFPTASGAATTITAEQKLKIREYVEEVVAQMLGGSLENVTVGRLSKSENYLPAIANGVLHSNSNNSGSNTNNNAAALASHNADLTDISHARLRQLIETIIAETLRLQPVLAPSAAVSEVAIDTHSNNGGTAAVNTKALSNGDVRRHRTEHYFEPKIYQELLATAVLNKIADTHGNARHLTDSGPDLLATADVNKNFKEHPSTISSGSSVEPQSDCSFTDTDQIINLSKGEDFSPCGSHTNLNADIMAATHHMDAGRESALSDYIAAHMVPLPDLSVPATESEEDDFASVTSSQLGDGNWEDNWLFKKKKSSLKAPVTAGGVGMLVPAPKEDVRAQIGDKIADEISDLSEIGSETDDSSLDLMRSVPLDPLNDRLLNKHLIGGQNTKMVLDELIDSASVISCTSPAENEPVYTETKNTHVVHATTTTTKTEAINTTVTKSVLTQSPPSTDTNTCEPCDPVILPPPTSFDDADDGEANADTTLNGTSCDNGNLITGSIAEREYKKWYNAVDMPNNPYAPEALKRRISGSQERFIDLPNISPSTEQNPITLMQNASTDEIEQNEERDIKRYSRDYYINDTKQSTPTNATSTTSMKSNSTTTLTGGSQESTTTDITINEAQIANTTATAINTSPSQDEHIFQAIPAQVVEGPASLDTQSTLSNQSIQSTTTTTSDDSDTIRIYDFKKQETTIIREQNSNMTRTTTTTTATTTATAQFCEAPTEIQQSTSVESNTVIDLTQDEQPPAKSVVERKARPTELVIPSVDSSGDPAITLGIAGVITSPYTPTRGSTPTAFKFLQPKRKLIEPSQVLSCDEDDLPPPTPVERKTIEEDVAQALPSVKALAQAFLLTAHKRSAVEKRWSAKSKVTTTETNNIKPVKSTPSPVPTKQQLETTPSSAEDATIASDLSSLETDPPTRPDIKDSKAATEKTAPTPLRTGFLKSNIAFFENLKFK